MILQRSAFSQEVGQPVENVHIGPDEVLHRNAQIQRIGILTFT